METGILMEVLFLMCGLAIEVQAATDTKENTTQYKKLLIYGAHLIA